MQMSQLIKEGWGGRVGGEVWRVVGLGCCPSEEEEEEEEES